MSPRSDIIIEGHKDLETTGPFANAWASDWIDSSEIHRAALLFHPDEYSSGVVTVAFTDEDLNGSEFYGYATVSFSPASIQEFVIPTRYFRVVIAGCAGSISVRKLA